MDWSSLSSIFKYVIIALLYVIIIVALGIMYRDIKKPRKKKNNISKRYALEVVKADNNSRELPKGAIIPIHDVVNVGRKQDNNLVLDDEFVSSYHSKFYTRQGSLIIQDLNSTNGTYVNSNRIKGEALLKTGDVIRIGNTVLKVIS